MIKFLKILSEIKMAPSVTPEKVFNLITNLRIKIRDYRGRSTLQNGYFRELSHIVQKTGVNDGNLDRLKIELESVKGAELAKLYLELKELEKNIHD